MQKLSPEEQNYLYWRAGFGPGTEISVGREISRLAAVNDLFEHSRVGRAITQVVFYPRQEQRMKDLPQEKKKMIRQQHREELIGLNQHWLHQMATDTAQLREKLTLFWHGHFACQIDHSFAMQDLNNLMRRLALSNLRDLLLGVSRHPAMLQYLNNRQNRKRHPNENFARELMELFTLGRGHYTEEDVKEAARAFTGWDFDQQGQFTFRKNQHDFGSKTFRGKTGNFGGEEIIDQILADKQTARHLSGKIYRFFVNDQPHPERIEELAGVFFSSGYDISALMRHLFLADWFYTPENRSAHIKSPVELLAGLMRQLHMDLPESKPLRGIQQILGQVLFRPPNVAGWPGGRSWIDSSTLVLRMTLPRALVLASEPDSHAFAFTLPGDLMDSGERRAQLGKVKKIGARIDWKAVEKHYKGVPTEELAQRVVEQLLPGTSHGPDLALIERFTDRSSRTSYLQTLYLQVLSLPEYQLT